MSTTEVDIEVHTLQVTTLSSRRVKIRYDDVTVSNRVNLVDPARPRTYVAKVRWRAPRFGRLLGLNIEFEPSFGGKLRWLIRLQTGI